MLAASKFWLAHFRCYSMRAGQESGFAPLKKSIGEDTLPRDLAQAVDHSTLKAALQYMITPKSSSRSSIRLSGRVQCLLSLLKKHLEVFTVRTRSEFPKERIVTRTMGAQNPFRSAKI